jgi:glutamyl-tRNA reductase
VGGRAVAFSDVERALEECDVLLVSASSAELLVERSAVESVMRRRDGRALLIVDIGMPRNVDPGSGEVFGVTLLDIDDLRAVGEQSMEQRRKEIAKVRDLIGQELERHRLERSAREVAPLIAALRVRAESIRLGELDRFRGRVDPLDEATRSVIDAITQGVVNKLLHEPTVRVKDTAGTPRGDLYADALTELFDLPTEATGTAD